MSVGERGSQSAGLTFMTRVVGAIAALDLAIMTLVTVVDVTGRYLFDAPVRGSDELIVFTLAICVFAGLPLAILHAGLIRVDLVLEHCSAATRRAAGLFANLVSGLFLCFCAVQVVGKADSLASYGDSTMFLRIPTAPLAYAIAIALAGSGLIMLWMAGRDLRLLTRKASGAPA